MVKSWLGLGGKKRDENVFKTVVKKLLEKHGKTLEMVNNIIIIILKVTQSLKKDLKPKFDMTGINFNQRSNVTSINKIKKLGWKPKVNFERAINNYIRWFKKSYLN